MEIRILRVEELMEALHLTWEVFAETVAPEYPAQGVEEFRRFIQYDYLMERWRRREIIFFGSYEEDELRGVSALGDRGHIWLLFVKTPFHGQGIGRQLVARMKRYASQTLRVSGIKVTVTPAVRGFYQKQGFCISGRGQVVHGIPFITMECLVIEQSTMAEAERSGTERRNRNILIGVVIANIALLVLITVIGSVVLGLTSGATRHMMRDKYGLGDYGNDDNGTVDEGTVDEGYGGIDFIEDYRADSVSYTVEEQTYSENKVAETSVEFEVHYPKLIGLATEKAEEINARIKKTAMQTVETTYLEPSDEMIEKFLMQPQEDIVSYVDYKVCFQDENFISIAFNDRFYIGVEDEGTDIRTLNINLKTGKVYDIEEVIKLSPDFMNEWLDHMEDEAPTASVLNEVSLDEFQKVLEGDTTDKVFSNAFFVDNTGIQVGVAYKGAGSEGDEAGWITAPFTYEEVGKYRTDSDFWGLVETLNPEK